MTKSKNKGATKSAFINSPLNYQGSKFGLLEQIIPLFPKDIVNFHDVFAGGASVAVNVNAQKTFINDKQPLLWSFYLYLYLFKKESIFKHIDVKVGSIATDDPMQKREAYQCDFVYGTTSDFGFDYLRDNLVLDISEKLQSKHHFAIIDEVDSVLIDEARTPLIISGSPEKTPEYLPLLVQIPPLLEKGIVIDKNSTATGRQEETGDFTLDFKSNNATLTDQGFEKVENILKEDYCTNINPIQPLSANIKSDAPNVNG